MSCQKQQTLSGSSDKSSPAESTWAQEVGRVDPHKLNDNLTDEQLARMFLPLAEIPWNDLIEPDDPDQQQYDTWLGSLVDRSVTDEVQARKAYLQGRRLLSEGSVPEAIEILKGALGHDPNSAAIHELLAKAYDRNGMPGESAVLARRAIALDDRHLEAYRILADYCLAQGKWARTAGHLQRALQSDGARQNHPLLALVHLQLAKVLEYLGYLSAAAEQYDQCYALLYEQSNYSQSNKILKEMIQRLHVPLLKAAMLRLQMGHIAEVVATLNRAQSLLSPEADLVGSFVLSLATLREKTEIRFQQVLALCEYLMASDDNQQRTVELFYQACETLSQREQYLNKLRQWYHPAHKQPRLLGPRLYAYGLTLTGEDDQARTILEDHLAAGGQDISLTRRDLGKLYAKKGHWLEMVLVYGVWLENDPGHIDSILANLDGIYSWIPELAQKLDSWQGDQRLDDNYGSAFLLGHLALRLGQEELAETWYRHSLAVNPDFGLGRKELLELLLKRRKNQEVLALMENQNATELTPEMLWYAGRACEGLAQWQKAQHYYQRVIELQKDQPGVYVALAQVLSEQQMFAQAEEILLQVEAQWPAYHPVQRQLVLLYLQWNAQESLHPTLHQATEKRAQQMLARWLRRDLNPAELTDKQNEIARQRIQELIAVLADLAREYPRGFAIGIMLSQLYQADNRTDEAVKQIERLLEEYPDQARILSLAATFNQYQGQLVRAAQLYRQAWQIEPENPRHLAACLKCLRLAGQSRQGLDLLLEAAGTAAIQQMTAMAALQEEAYLLFATTRAYSQAVDFYRQWYQNARAAWAKELQTAQDLPEISMVQTTAQNLLWALTEAGLYDQAIEHTRTIYGLYEITDLRWVSYLVRMLNIRKQHPQSRSLLEELLTRQSDSVGLRLNLYSTMLDQGLETEALTSAKEWQQQLPDDKNRKKMLIFILQLAGHFEQAIVLLEEHMAQQPGETLELDLIDMLLAAGKYDLAEQKISQLPEASPLKLESQVQLEVARDNCPAAIRRIEALSDRIEPAQSFSLKAQVWYSCGQVEQAIALQQQAIEADPNDTEARLQLSVYLGRMGREDQAILELERILGQYPDDAGIKNNLGYQLVIGAQQSQRAEQLLEESLQKQPESAPTLDSLGWLYYKRGEFPQALELIYQAAAMLGRPDVEILEHLGDVTYRLGETAHARWHWQQAIREIQRRLPTAKYLQEDKSRLENKLQRLAAGEDVPVETLFINPK